MKAIFLLFFSVTGFSQSFNHNPSKGQSIVNGEEITAEAIERFVTFADGRQATYMCRLLPPVSGWATVLFTIRLMTTLTARGY